VADLTDEPPLPHLIENVCRESGSILLYGKTGIGKTRFLWQLACGLARGQETLGLRPMRPLRISLVEADMFRTDFESLVKEYAQKGIVAPDSIYWFSRDDTTPYWIQGQFGKALLEHNRTHDIDLTIYDAIPDIFLGDANDSATAMKTIRELHAAANGRAYLGVLTQRKGQPTGRDTDGENVDEMLGSQAWARAASSVWQLTNVPSLVWVKHRLCQKPAPIPFTVAPNGVWSVKGAGARGLIEREAAKGFTSIRELVARVQATDEYKTLDSPYKDRMLRELAADALAKGRIIMAAPTPPPDT
jgi:hypothetical protein